MKRDKTQYQLKRIKVRTPILFWKYCWKCEGYFKKEPMFFWRVAHSGPSGWSFSVYNCMECCPTKADVVEKNERYFGKHTWEDLHKGDKDALAAKILATPLD